MAERVTWCGSPPRPSRLRCQTECYAHRRAWRLLLGSPRHNEGPCWLRELLPATTTDPCLAARYGLDVHLQWLSPTPPDCRTTKQTHTKARPNKALHRTREDQQPATRTAGHGNRSWSQVAEARPAYYLNAELSIVVIFAGCCVRCTAQQAGTLCYPRVGAGVGAQSSVGCAAQLLVGEGLLGWHEAEASTGLASGRAGARLRTFVGSHGSSCLQSRRQPRTGGHAAARLGIQDAGVTCIR